MGSQIEFRDTVHTEDVEQVKKIVESTGMFSAAEVRVAQELVMERLRLGTESGYEFLFAQNDKGPVGYACYGTIPCTVGSFDIYWVAVQKEWQRNGIGKMLLAKAESNIAAVNGRSIYIETSSREQYAPTRSFYMRNGYEVAAVLKDFYSAGDDKVIFCKHLAGPARTNPHDIFRAVA